MKHFVLILCLCTLGNIVIFAQEVDTSLADLEAEYLAEELINDSLFNTPRTLEFGLTIGYGVSNLNTTDKNAQNTINNPNTSSEKTRGVFNGGIQLQYNISESISLQTGLLFDQRGYRKDEGDTSRVTFNYLNVPLILKWHFRVDKLRPYFQFGLYYSHVLSVDGKLQGVTTDFSSGYSSQDVGLTFGFGLDTHLNDYLKAFLETNVSGSISDVDNRQEFKAAHFVARFSLGTRFVF